MNNADDLSDLVIKENTAPRTPCILVLDTSASMGRPSGAGPKRRIDELNLGVSALHSSLLKDEEAVKRVEIAIVRVGGPNNAAWIAQNFENVDRFAVPTFEPEGATPLGEGVRIALDALTARCHLLQSYGRIVSRPWMFVLSDGEATDEESAWKLAAKQSREAERKGRCLVYPLLIDSEEGPAYRKLRELTDTHQVHFLESTQFVEFFRWVSRTVSRQINTDSEAVEARSKSIFSSSTITLQ